MNNWLKEFPELSKDIEEISKDGLISGNDYEYIKEKYRILKVKKVN
jgi:hypothetical protein